MMRTTESNKSQLSCGGAGVGSELEDRGEGEDLLGGELGSEDAVELGATVVDAVGFSMQSSSIWLLLACGFSVERCDGA